MGGLVRYVFAMFAAISACAYAGEFTYSMPPGWVNVREAMARGEEFPRVLVQTMNSGNFAIFAADPRGITLYKAGATMNAVEAPKTGRVLKAQVEQDATGVVQQINAGGRSARLVEADVVKLNGIDSGKIVMEVETDEGTRAIVQYIITGRTTASVLTYAVARSELGSYASAFEASAAATKGMYDHGKIDWKRSVMVGVLTAAAFAVASLILQRVRRRRDRDDAESGETAVATQAAALPPAASKFKASKHVWMCPSCSNPVPMRLDQCRCGAAKPA